MHILSVLHAAPFKKVQESSSWLVLDETQEEQASKSTCEVA